MIGAVSSVASSNSVFLNKKYQGHKNYFIHGRELKRTRRNIFNTSEYNFQIFLNMDFQHY